MVRRLRSEEYGCKVIWATSLASYPQLPVAHLCSFQHQCLQTLFATEVTSLCIYKVGAGILVAVVLGCRKVLVVLAMVGDFSPSLH